MMVRRKYMHRGLTWHDDGVCAGVGQHDSLHTLGPSLRRPDKFADTHYWDHRLQPRRVILSIK